MLPHDDDPHDARREAEKPDPERAASREIGTATPGSWTLGAAAVLAVVVALAVLAVTRQLPIFLLSGAQVWPLLILAVLGTLAPMHAWARGATWLWLGVDMVGLVLLSAAFGAITVVPLPASAGALRFDPSAGRLIVAVALTMATCGAVSLLWLLRDLRVLAARFWRIDPRDIRHTVALIMLTDVVLSALGLLALLHGRPPLLTFVANVGDRLTSRSLGSSPDTVLSLLYQLFWTVPLALTAAGISLRRTPAQTLKRLGLVAPSGTDVAIGLGLGAVLLIVSGAVDGGITVVFQAMHWPTTDMASFEKLLGNAFSPLGAVVIGVTAGLGEELSVRGLLQPRFGIVASSVVFASAHAYQYGPDALLSVFLLGIGLGVIRAYRSTTVSALTHGSYNCLAVLASLAALHR